MYSLPHTKNIPFPLCKVFFSLVSATTTLYLVHTS